MSYRLNLGWLAFVAVTQVYVLVNLIATRDPLPWWYQALLLVVFITTIVKDFAERRVKHYQAELDRLRAEL